MKDLLQSIFYSHADATDGINSGAGSYTNTGLQNPTIEVGDFWICLGALKFRALADPQRAVSPRDSGITADLGIAVNAKILPEARSEMHHLTHRPFT